MQLRKNRRPKQRYLQQNGLVTRGPGTLRFLTITARGERAEVTAYDSVRAGGRELGIVETPPYTTTALCLRERFKYGLFLVVAGEEAAGGAEFEVG